MEQLNWNKFVEKSYRPFMNFAVGRRISTHDAQDIVQMAYIKMAEKKYDRYKDKSLMDTYMSIGFQTIHRLVLNFHRLLKYKGRNNVVSMTQRIEELYIYTPYFMEDDIWEHIKNNLTANQFSLLTAVATGHTYKEAATMHNMTTGAAKAIVHTARSKIRQLHLDI